MTSATDRTHETYMQIRERNIAANRNLLLSLQLSGPGLTPKLIHKPAVNNANISNENASQLPQQTRKTRKKSTLPAAASDACQVNADGRRRSGRILKMISNQDNSQKEESSEDEEEYEARDSDCSDGSDAQEDQVVGQGKKRKSTWHPPREPKRARGGQPPKRKAKSLKGSRPDPKIFGHQIGTEVGDWWDSRMMCSQAGVHAPPVSGIAGNDGVGCYSVALSGGYEDDVDLGYAFTFTGAGGRALSGTRNNPKNLRTAPQSFDQEFTSVNAALKLSCEKKNPVRVIRGYKNHSPFAPDEGYRYDGLYKVEKCWREPGQSGFQVCKFAFVRLPDQPRIPVKKGREAEAEQMYQDMGFKLDDLPPLVEERQPWTQSLAKQRQQAKRETLLKTEDEHSNMQEDSADLLKQQHDQETEADKETHDVNVETRNSNAHPEEDTHDSTEVLNEQENAKMEEIHDVNLNTDVLCPANAPKQPETGKEDYEIKQKAVDDELKNAHGSTVVSNEHENAQKKETHDINSNKEAFDSVQVSKHPETEEKESETKQRVVEDELKQGAHGLIEVSDEQKNAIKQDTLDANLNKEVSDSVNVFKLLEMEKEKSETKQPILGDELKEDESNPVHVSKQDQEERSEEPPNGDLKFGAENSFDVAQQPPNGINQEAVAGILHQGEDGSSSIAPHSTEDAANSQCPKYVDGPNLGHEVEL